MFCRSADRGPAFSLLVTFNGCDTRVPRKSAAGRDTPIVPSKRGITPASASVPSTSRASGCATGSTLMRSLRPASSL